MAPHRKKNKGTETKEGPAMATRSRTLTTPPTTLPETRRKRNVAEKGTETKTKKEAKHQTVENSMESPVLDIKQLAENGTWGILHNVKEASDGIFLRGDKFTIGRENCDWNIEELPEKEVLCTLKMSSERDQCQYSILSHSVSRLLKLNDLILMPDEEKPLVTGDVICWSLKTACFYVFLGTAHANRAGDRQNCTAEKRLEDPTGVLSEAKADIVDVIQNLSSVVGLLRGSHQPPEVQSKDKVPTVPASKPMSAPVDAMDIDTPPVEQTPDLMDSLKKISKHYKSSTKQASGNARPEKEDTQVSLLSVMESIKEKIVAPEDISFSFKNFPYYLSDRVQDRLTYTATVYFQHQNFASYVHNIETLNRRILLTGPMGSGRCMEAVVAAVAKDCGAELLKFDWDLIHGDGEDDNDEEGGTADELLDDFDFLEEFEKRLQNSENLNLGFGTTRIKATAKRSRGKVSTVGSEYEKLMASKKAHKSTAAGTATKAFRKGDRVVFIGNSTNAKQTLSSRPETSSAASKKAAGKEAEGSGEASAGPTFGCTGRIVLVLPDEPQRVGVCFDAAVRGGWSLGEACEPSRGFLCDPADLKHESVSKRSGQENMIIDLFFDVGQQIAKKKPLVIHIKDAELSVLGKLERFGRFKRRLDMLHGSVLVVGTTIREQKKDSGPAGLFSKFGSHPSAMLEFGFFEKLGKADDKSVNKAENSKSVKLLSRLFPNHLAVVPPVNDPELTEWKEAIERDTELLNEESNRRLMTTAVQKCNAHCPDLDKIAIKDAQMPMDDIEKLVGLAVAHRLTQGNHLEKHAGKLVIDRNDIEKASSLFKGFQDEPVANKGELQDVTTDNEFEKRLLAEVVPPSEVGVGFDDIGALENVKKTLQEIVMLPLQRPELFVRGQLLKPTKGVLLFGPPGTGKTMLAKAVARESGANFLNMSVSSIASKWFGEGEKYVRALFSLAHKISPCVIFVDEVDSLLGRRDKTNEHEAMRKIKNEFMANWDGLRTNERDRVLVLAATNRPMDLDEAVIRRMPRRLLVDLPDAENRIKILRTILRHEDIHSDFRYEEIAAVTDGYSGSDLKNLCLEAALRPVRDFLKHENEQKPSPTETEPPADQSVSTKSPDEKLILSLKSKKPSSAGHRAKKAKTVHLRPINMEDMLEAARQIASSVSTDAISMTEIRSWNQLYGEGGNRQKTPLSYFM